MLLLLFMSLLLQFPLLLQLLLPLRRQQLLLLLQTHTCYRAEPSEQEAEARYGERTPVSLPSGAPAAGLRAVLSALRVSSGTRRTAAVSGAPAAV